MQTQAVSYQPGEPETGATQDLRSNIRLHGILVVERHFTSLTIRLPDRSLKLLASFSNHGRQPPKLLTTSNPHHGSGSALSSVPGAPARVHACHPAEQYRAEEQTRR